MNLVKEVNLGTPNSKKDKMNLKELQNLNPKLVRVRLKR